MSKRMLRSISRLHETAPVAAIACALVLPMLFPHEQAGAEPDGVELAMVAAAVEAVPWRVGPWVAQDVPIPEAARRLLRPNAMLSRRYVNLVNGMTVDLAVVHCGDSRDMLGHYPPVCYPSNGWTTMKRGGGTDGAGPEDFKHGELVELSFNELTIPARVYGFSRSRSWSEESHIRIYNFFILPDGTLTADIEDVGLRTNWLGARITGVAQIQILTDARIGCEDAADAAGEVLEAIAGLFDSLGVNMP